MKTPTITTILALTLACASSGAAAFAQAPTPPPTGGTPEAEKAAEATAAAAQEDDDEDVNLAQPDFTIVGLPTTLRMPKGKFAFRVTHRFGRPLDDGDFGDLASDLFGLDAGGLIGLEVRYGVLKGTQVGVLRTSDRTIQFFGQQQVKAQSESFPVGLAVHLTADGTNNFKDSYTPMIGVAVSRELGRYGAVYVEPMWVNNSNLLPSELVDDNDTFMVGLGARIRIRPTVNLVGEFISV